eukprot:CAMPEP_0184549250 /NCGR_PEP_ID=MMETSP0199_2-20130426/8639_1 /TAXON_ID=1112570 /ORGANISM="Thraustochytrium sp., Strain LLF1b" /LENGTH=100 /DNA_ID=CAMNT_0026943959 /DNA_START=68 /DNA_END=366 /DNA_ORIENTATION=-
MRDDHLAGELGNSLGTLGYCVLCELTRENQAYSGLYLTRREGRLLVVLAKLASLGRQAVEDVADERVHDAHRLLGDTDLGVNLLEHTVDVGRVRLDALLR